jgi:SAM-dependent methyltransferase
MLQPHFERLVRRRLDGGRAPRLLDLGCGGGDGFELLTSMRRGQPALGEATTEILPPDRLGSYTGVDINADLLNQARERCRCEERAEFLQADLRDGLSFLAAEDPYDIYFTAFGTLSHFHEDELVRLLGDIARHAEDGALIVADWLGRYAYEWMELWDADLTREKWMDYRISYIYAEEERASRPVESFELRLLSGDEVRRAAAGAEEASGARLLERALFDRSLLVGRHMDTGDYNPRAAPLRSRVNRLHEPLCRTDLEGLLFDLCVVDGFPAVAGVLEGLHSAWNTVVRFTGRALERWNHGKSPAFEAASFSPARNGSTRRALERMAHVLEIARWIEADDVRAEFIEPQLGFVLRDLERIHQQGVGSGHGIVGIYEVRKP